MKRRSTKVCFVVVLVVCCFAIDAFATIYKCVSPQGSVKFQDYPCPANTTVTQGLGKIAKASKKTLLGGIQFNPGNDIPENAFRAYYFNVNQPTAPIDTEIVQAISVNYHADQFHHIPPKNFMGYWIGRFVFKKNTKLLLTLSQHHAVSRISIDGRKIYEGSGNPNQLVEFRKGSHRIEVEYLNHGHVTDFRITFQEAKG